MKTSREDLIKRIHSICLEKIRDKQFINSAPLKIREKYGIMVGSVVDILTMRKQPQDESDFVLFAILEATKPAELEQYFLPEEIKTLSETKLDPYHIQYPLRWPMIQVRDGQWIGKITVKELMALRDAQLIVYNENAQRTLKRMMRGGEEIFQININRKAVSSIEQTLKAHQFIPNTITLNITDYQYCDYCNGELVLSEGIKFDILDGYHRYLAMSNVYNFDETFDLQMELRVVIFDESTARQFIWQEDQKTKMAKVDSDAFNQTSNAADVLNMLQLTPVCGKLCTREPSSILDYSTIFACINSFFIKGSQQLKLSDKLQIRDKIVYCITSVIEQDYSFFDNKLPNKTVICMMYLFSLGNSRVNDINKLSDAIPAKGFLYGRKVDKVILKRLNKLYGEVFANV